ncbi:MAG: hypothetical protein PVF75_02915 [Granulosicoccaceae bacterium]|jgi:hypothetical protein
MTDSQVENSFEAAFRRVVELGNGMAAGDEDAHPWDIADGMLAGAIQYWLYARQPCGDHSCDDCEPISTAELRTAELMKLVQEFAEESEYYHAPTDMNVGRA